VANEARSINCGDEGFAAAFRRLLLRAIAVGRRRKCLRDTTLAQYRADLDRRLDRVLALPRRGDAAEKLRRRIARTASICSCSSPTALCSATNNICERALRPSVIFHNVTNGFRSEWGAQTYAAFRSVVSTAKLNKRWCSMTSATCSPRRHPTKQLSRGELLHSYRGATGCRTRARGIAYGFRG
jgi:hypothetical protein